MQSSRPAEARDLLDIAKLKERRTKICSLIVQENQSHDQKMQGLNVKLSDIDSRLAEYGQTSGQEVC